MTPGLLGILARLFLGCSVWGVFSGVFPVHYAPLGTRGLGRYGTFFLGVAQSDTSLLWVVLPRYGRSGRGLAGGFLILLVEAGWCWRASWHPRGNFGGGWNSGFGIGLGREFRPLATLGVTEGGGATLRRSQGERRGTGADPSTGSGRTEKRRGTIKRPWGGGGTGRRGLSKPGLNRL